MWQKGSMQRNKWSIAIAIKTLTYGYSPCHTPFEKSLVPAMCLLPLLAPTAFLPEAILGHPKLGKSFLQNVISNNTS